MHLVFLFIATLYLIKYLLFLYHCIYSSVYLLVHFLVLRVIVIRFVVSALILLANYIIISSQTPTLTMTKNFPWQTTVALVNFMIIKKTGSLIRNDSLNALWQILLLKMVIATREQYCLAHMGLLLINFSRTSLLLGSLQIKRSLNWLH